MVPFNLRDLDTSGLRVHPKKQVSVPGRGRRGQEGLGGIGTLKPSVANGFRSFLNPLQKVACAANYKGLGGLGTSWGSLRLSIADGFRELLLLRDGWGRPAASLQSGYRFWKEEATEAPGNKTLKFPLATSLT